MIIMHSSDILIRKPNKGDSIEKISELLYNTDPYIYPYWFGNLECCKKELTPLLLEDRFFFNINNLYIAIDKKNDFIIGVICIVDRNSNLDYDYSELKAKNEKYCFVVVNYIEGLIKEVQESDFAYISNICVDKNYRGMHVGKYLLNYVVELYKDKLYKEIVLDVLAQNPGAIKLYQNLGFKQFTELFKGFNDPSMDKPDVFSMNIKLE